MYQEQTKKMHIPNFKSALAYVKSLQQQLLNKTLLNSRERLLLEHLEQGHWS